MRVDGAVARLSGRACRFESPVKIWILAAGRVCGLERENLNSKAQNSNPIE